MDCGVALASFIKAFHLDGRLGVGVEWPMCGASDHLAAGSDLQTWHAGQRSALHGRHTALMDYVFFGRTTDGLALVLASC